MSAVLRGWLLVGAGSLFLGAPAKAMVLDAETSLRTFSVIVFDDLTSGADVDGRTYVGGNLGGGGSTFFAQSGSVAPSSLDALYVGGNVTGGFKQVNNNGNAQIAGNVQNMNMNGGTAFIGGTITGTVNGNSVTGAMVTIPDVQTALEAVSDEIAALTANSNYTIMGNLLTLNAVPDASGVAVFDLPAGLLDTVLEITFNLNGATDVFINVGGTSVLVNENFLGGNGNLVAERAIWNFYEAADVTITRQFHGAVLAPDATVTNSQQINGNVVARNFNQNAQVRLPTFSGTLPNTAVPEPHHATVLLVGLSAVAVARRKRRRFEATP